MANKKAQMSIVKQIQSGIVQLPGRPPVMLTKDVAYLYEVKPGQITRAVSRNPERFPEDFCFKLSDEEFKSLRRQIDASNRGGPCQKRWKHNP